MLLRKSPRLFRHSDKPTQFHSWFKDKERSATSLHELLEKKFVEKDSIKKKYCQGCINHIQGSCNPSSLQSSTLTCKTTTEKTVDVGCQTNDVIVIDANDIHNELSILDPNLKADLAYGLSFSQNKQIYKDTRYLSKQKTLPNLMNIIPSVYIGA